MTFTQRIVTAGLLASSFVLSAGPAGAATPGAATAVPAHAGAGYNHFYGATDTERVAVGSEFVTVEGTDTVEVFCVRFGALYNRSGSFYSAAYSAIAHLGAAADIAMRHGEIGTPLADANLETAATQLAIWKLTDAITVDVSSISTGDPAVVARVVELVEGAGSRSAPPASFVLSASAGAVQGDSVTVDALFETAAGAPLAGEELTLGDDTATTDSDGKASFTVRPGAQVREMTVGWDGVLPAGSLLEATSAGDQPVVTVSDAKIHREATVNIAAVTPVSTTSTSTTIAPTTVAPPTAAPTTVASTNEELPYTGAPVGPVVVLTAAAIAGLCALVLRRRLARP